MKSVLFFVVLISSAFTVRAADFLEGYIVLANNDTIACKFKVTKGGGVTNFFSKLTVVNEQGEEKVYVAADREVLAYGFTEFGKRYEYLYIDARQKVDRRFYQRIVDGPKYKLYVHTIVTSTYPGIGMGMPQYVLFTSAGESVKFENCILCPWKKQMRLLAKDDAKALELIEGASRLKIPELVAEMNKD